MTVGQVLQLCFLAGSSPFLSLSASWYFSVLRVFWEVLKTENGGHQDGSVRSSLLPMLTTWVQFPGYTHSCYKSTDSHRLYSDLYTCPFPFLSVHLSVTSSLPHPLSIKMWNRTKKKIGLNSHLSSQCLVLKLRDLELLIRLSSGSPGCITMPAGSCYFNCSCV